MATTKVWDGSGWATIGRTVYTPDPNLFGNGDFEQDNGSGGFANWSLFWKTGTPVVTAETNLAHVHRGKRALKVELPAGSTRQNLEQGTFAVQPGSVVTVQIAAKGSVTECGLSIGCFTNAVGEGTPTFFATGVAQSWEPFTLNTDYDVYQARFTVPAGDNQMGIIFALDPPAGGSGTVWVDTARLRIEEVGGEAILPWVSFTPSGSFSGGATALMSLSGKYRKVGVTVDCIIRADFTGTPGVTGVWNAVLPFPPNTDVIATWGAIGVASFRDASTSLTHSGIAVSSGGSNASAYFGSSRMSMAAPPAVPANGDHVVLACTYETTE